MFIVCLPVSGGLFINIECIAITFSPVKDLAYLRICVKRIKHSRYTVTSQIRWWQSTHILIVAVFKKFRIVDIRLKFRYCFLTLFNIFLSKSHVSHYIDSKWLRNLWIQTPYLKLMNCIFIDYLPVTYLVKTYPVCFQLVRFNQVFDNYKPILIIKSPLSFC